YDSPDAWIVAQDPIGLHGGLRPQGYVTNPLEFCDPLGLAKNDASRKTAAELTDEEFVQRVGEKAERWGVNNGHGSAGSGHVQGSKKHTYADKLMRRYQKMTGQKTHLETETSYSGGHQVSRGTLGSARPDVYNPQTGEVFDYKFTRNSTSPISQRQQQHNIKNLPKVTSQTAIHP
ncbi:hypothetical protein WCT55_23305, partial [Pectobacterium parmentieri]